MATAMWYERPRILRPRRLPFRTNPSFNEYAHLEYFSWVLDNAVEIDTFTNDFMVKLREPLVIRNCPNLVTINTSFLQRGTEINIFSNPALTTINFRILEFTQLNCTNNSFLTTLTWNPISLPMIGGHYNFGPIIDFSGCALSEATVNALLAYLVIVNIQNWGDTEGNWAGNLNISGGTNAAPTGQGITDKNTLIGRGATITTN